MPEKRRMAALSIGVGDAQPLAYLAGAINAAHAFHQWAGAAGYQAVLLTDEDRPITVAGLGRKLKAVLKPRTAPIHRLVLYFAGHGVMRGAEEGLWLLSDWHMELRAVAIEGLKRRLKSWGVKQVTIVADACRSLPTDIDVADLVPDAVLGRGAHDQPTMPAVDKFIAAQDGAATYTIPGPNPEDDRCIFSGVLLQGLWGTEPAAFSKVRKNLVTSSSLGTYLASEVPKVAERYKRKLNPAVSPTFPEDDDVYLDGEIQKLSPPSFPPWPSAKGLLAMGHPVRVMEDLERHATDTTDRKQRAEALLQRVRGQSVPDHFETGCGFAIQGEPVAAVWTTGDMIAEPAGEVGWWRIGDRKRPYYVKSPTPVLIEFRDGLFAAVTALPRFIGSVQRDGRGVSALIYRQTYAGRASAKLAEQAIAQMEGGALRADASIDLAIKLREFKHVDPVLGVLSAYLYDSIGDIENIRRMACYYVAHHQPIPYDVAILAQLRGELRDGILWATVPPVPRRKPRTEAETKHDWTWEETPECQGPVGGHWPWLRQGWTFLDDPAADGSTLVLPGVMELAKRLTSGRFTTLDAKGGAKLAKLFKLKRTLDPTQPSRRRS